MNDTPSVNPPRPGNLAELLRQAAVELERQTPPPFPADRMAGLAALRAAPVEAAPALVLAAPDAPPVPTPRWPGRAGWAVGALLLAGLAMVWLLRPGATPRALPAAAWAEAPFVPVVSEERWLRLAQDGPAPAWIVTAEMPQAQLARYGLPFDPGRAGEAVRAELLVNPAGEVLALRRAP